MDRTSSCEKVGKKQRKEAVDSLQRNLERDQQISFASEGKKRSAPRDLTRDFNRLQLELALQRMEQVTYVTHSEGICSDRATKKLSVRIQLNKPFLDLFSVQRVQTGKQCVRV